MRLFVERALEIFNELAIVMLRVKERIAQCKDSIDKQNPGLKTVIQQRRQKRKSSILRYDAELKSGKKSRENLSKLEHLKIEVIDFRSEKRRMLKWLVRRQNIKQDEDESPTHILNNSNYFTDGNNEDDSDMRLALRTKATEKLRMDVVQLFEESVIDEADTPQTNGLGQQDNQDEYKEESEEAMTIEDMRLAARAKATEELRMAVEVRRHEMAKVSKEREETKLASWKDEEGGLEKTDFGQNSARELIAGVPISTLCKLLDCKKQELYGSDLLRLSFKPVIEMMDDSSADANSIQRSITNLVQDIERYNTRIFDIELMNSLILAEIASIEGKDEFKMVVRKGSQFKRDKRRWLKKSLNSGGSGQ